MQTVRCGAAVVLAIATAACAAAEPPAGGRPGRLDVAGGSIAGDLVPAAAADGGIRETLLWRSPRFAAPFEFRIGDVAGIAFEPPADAAGAVGPFVHLRGGDVIAAAIESLAADALVVSVAGPDGPQRLRIARGEVEAIARTSGGGGSFAGPAGLAGWEQAPAATWREEAGRIMTDRPGAAVSRDVGGPARARFDIQVSRRGAAEFRIAVAAAEKSADDGYAIQAVDVDGAGVLMLVRRAGGEATIEPLPTPPWRGDTLRVVLFVDQERGRLAAMLPDAAGADATRITDVTLRPAGDVRPSGRFRLECTTGGICLERLAVSAWRAPEPALRDVAATTVTTRSGTLVGYAVTAFDAAAGEYVLARGGETQRVKAADVEELRFPEPGDAVADGAIRVVRSDGCSLGGDLVKVDDRAVWLRRRGIDADVAIPRNAIVAIRSQQPRTRPDEPGGRVGTLVAGTDRLRGWLVAGGDGGGLAWRPLGGVAAAAFAEQPDAEVEYVARRPERKAGEVEVGGIGGLVNRDAAGFFIVAMMTEDGAAARDGRIQPGDRIMAVAPVEKARYVETKDLDNETVMQLLRGRLGTTVRLKVTDAAGGNPRDIELTRGPISVAGREVLEQALQAHERLGGIEDAADDGRAAYPAVVVLRSGDKAPCRIESVDADALLLRSPLAGDAGTAAVRVPTELVKALELIPAAASRALDPMLFARLLTLPRMQRDRPPTHLLRLANGDYLRGRLVGLDESTVTFEVLDVVKQLPRRQVARIIWLHPEPPRPAEAEPASAAPEPAEAGFVVQGIAADGRRLTLMAETMAGDVLRGRSEAFGESVIDLTQVDRLLLGAAVGRDGGDLEFAKWTLKPAAEPRALGKPDPAMREPAGEAPDRGP